MDGWMEEQVQYCKGRNYFIIYIYMISLKFDVSLHFGVHMWWDLPFYLPFVNGEESDSSVCVKRDKISWKQQLPSGVPRNMTFYWETSNSASVSVFEIHVSPLLWGRQLFEGPVSFTGFSLYLMFNITIFSLKEQLL